jgi:hypothetical protein
MVSHSLHRAATAFALIVVTLGQLLHVSLTEAATSTAQNPLHQEISGYKNGESDFFRALQEVSYKYHVPLGIETDAQGQAVVGHISINVSKGTVADIFDAIVHAAPNYKWVESSGVVNVMPLHDTDSVLNLKIARFYLRHATPDDLPFAIRSLPEVEAWLNQRQLAERGFITSSILIGANGETDQPRVSLRLKNVTLREIMNAAVKKPGLLAWFVGRYGDHNQYLNISID